MDPEVEWLWYEPGDWDCRDRKKALATFSSASVRASFAVGWLECRKAPATPNLPTASAALAELPVPQEPASRRLLVLFVEAVTEVLATERYQTAVDTAVFC